MTDIKTNKNGQMYFDFDSLAEKTSVIFAKRVKMYLDSIIERYGESSIVTYHESFISERFQTVYIAYDSCVTRIERYFYGKEEIDISTVSLSEMAMLKMMIEGKFNG